MKYPGRQDCSAWPKSAFASCLFFGCGHGVRLAASTADTSARGTCSGQHGNLLHPQDRQVTRRNAYRLTGHPSAMRSRPMVLVALLLAAFLISLDTTLVNVALPALVRELHATTTQLQWVVDSYNLVFAALLLTFGSLSDRFGRKG